MGCQGGKEEKVDGGDKFEGAATPTMGDSPEKSKKKKKERVPKEKKAKPAFRIDSDGKYLRPLDETVQTFFDKYDLDMSGSMNSHTEIRQLTTNLLATALKIREFKADNIKGEIAKLPEDTDWSIDQYREWFFATFKFSELRLDEVPEESALQLAVQAIEAEIDENFCELIDEYGGAGQRAVGAVNKAYSFLGADQFKELVDAAYQEASGGDDKPLKFAEFEDALESLITELMKETGHLAEDAKPVSIDKNDVQKWFELVDADKSGTVGKGELKEVIAFFCLNYKLKSSAEILAAVIAKPAFTDYEGAPFRMGGNCKVQNGFQLCAAKPHQEGHFLCTHAFDADKGEIYVKVEYQALSAPGKDEAELGEGLCIYLADPSVKGWNTDFDGSGPVGFQGKSGGVVGVFLDLAGNISGKGRNHICVKSCDEEAECLAAVDIGDSLATAPGEWRRVQIKFDTQEHKCDVSIKMKGEWKKVIDDVKFDGIDIPKKVCPGVCGASSDEYHGCFRVNKLKVEMKPDDD